METEAWIRAAQAPWPAWRGAAQVEFLAHVAALRGEGEDAVPLESLRGPDLWLVFHALRRDPGALSALEQHCFQKLGAYLQTRRASPSQADEAVQRLRHKLLIGVDGGAPKLAAYSGRGDLLAWARVAVLREWLNTERQHRNEQPHDDGDTLQELASNDLELELLKGKYKDVFHRAFQSSVAELESSERLLLKLHYLDRLSMDEVGKVLGVHRLTVLRRLERVRRELSEQTKARLQQELRLASPEVESVLRLIRSRLDVSLHRVLGAAQVGER